MGLRRDAWKVRLTRFAWMAAIVLGGCRSPSPDGLGVCCPMTFEPCGCSDQRGGFAISSLECGEESGCDGRWVRETDSHGCPVWRDVTFGGPADICCGCVPDTGPFVLDASSPPPPDASRRRDASSLDAPPADVESSTDAPPSDAHDAPTDAAPVDTGRRAA